MESDLLGLFLVLAIAANGLLAGAFFVFSVGVVPGLRDVEDQTYVRTYRAINRAILNGAFLSVFLLAPLASVGSVAVLMRQAEAAALSRVVVAAACSALTVAITAWGNVPLNRDLDQSTATSQEQWGPVRQRFEHRWDRWNLVRTLTSTGALVSLAVASVTG